MNMSKVSAAVAMVGLLTAVASAAVYSDSFAAGSGQTISFTSISDNVGLFGGYNRSGDQLTWLPGNFKAESSNGTAQTTSDTLLMTITAQPGDWLTNVRIWELGDYTFSGTAGNAGATSSGTLIVTELAPSGGLAGYDAFSQAFTLAADPFFGLWQGELVVDLTGMQITSVRISWQNNLQASSEQGTTSLIQKKYGELGITADVIPIPEPATISLLALAGLAVVRRRWR